MTDARAGRTVANGLAGILGMNADQETALRASFGTDAAGPTPVPNMWSSASSSPRRRATRCAQAGLATNHSAGLGLEPHAVRFYPTRRRFPNTTLASQLLGFVTQDGQGRYGVEQASQSVLAGAGNATADAGGSRARCRRPAAASS